MSLACFAGGIAHRLALECPDVKTGDRFLLSAEDESAELATWQLQDYIRGMYPNSATGVDGLGAGEKPSDPEKAFGKRKCPTLSHVQSGGLLSNEAF